MSIEINDFYSSAFLITSGFPLSDVYKNGQQTTFVFEESKNLKEQLGKYYAMDASVNASRYAQEIKKLKTIIHTNSNLKQEVKSY